MQAGWCMQAGQCGVCVARVVWHVQGCGMVHQWWFIQTCSAVGYVHRWCGACRHMAGAMRVVRSYVDAVRVVRADIGAVHADIGAVHADISAVQWGYDLSHRVHCATLRRCVLAEGRYASTHTKAPAGCRCCCGPRSRCRAPPQAQGLAA